MFQQRDKKSGFTLIEVLIAVVLVGLAIASIVGANIAFTRSNHGGVTRNTAEFLVEQIRELTAMLAVVDPQGGDAVFGPEEAGYANYDDLDDFDGAGFNPPIDSSKTVLSDFSAYTQQVSVDNVNASDFEQIVSDHGSDFVRVTVTVLMDSDVVASSSWIRAGY